MNIPDRTKKSAMRCGVVLLTWLLGACFVYAKGSQDLKIIFTGQAYAALYPCICPHDPEGGLARRATVIKKARVEGVRLLVLEAGFSFASGESDQYRLNAEMDGRRTEIYLRALKKMDYDALLVSSQEYAFGSDFLGRFQDMPFVSSNLEGFKQPYVLKDLKGLKVGVLGLTDALVTSKGVGGWQAPKQVLEQSVALLKKKGAQIIILLSALPPAEDEELLKTTKGIDVVINASPSFGSVNLVEKDGVRYLTTWWQARRTGILTLQISDGKIINSALDAAHLNAEVADDEAIASLLPQCFSDRDCRPMAGYASKCDHAGTLEGRCRYTALPRVAMTVIIPKTCGTCRIDDVLEGLKKNFGNPQVRYLVEDDPSAKKLIDEFKITMLPAYFFHKDVESLGTFSTLSQMLTRGKDVYYLAPGSSGVSYLLGRSRTPHTIDLFFDFRYPQLPELFRMLKAYAEKHPEKNIRIHFLAVHDAGGNIISQGPAGEVEEFMRIACIEDLYPKSKWDYLVCRAVGAQSTWWDECAGPAKIDASRIKACALSPQGKAALEQRIQLTEEIKIATGPTFVIDNKEIIGIVSVPSLDEFERVTSAASGQKEKRGKDEYGKNQ